ncbi:MAG: hemolysin family protein [Eubacterium sp.]|nr:hemolysin family protein [Eubacterium sp.]
MDNSTITTIIFLAILVALSGYFSATETAFSSLNKIRIKNLANNDGNKKAKLVLRLSENYDKLLSTILIGNNIVNIGAASIGTTIFVKYFGNAGVTISTAVITVVVLIFGEISPKSMAKESPEKFAMFSAPFLRVLLIVLTPLNFIFMQWKRLLSRIFKVSADKGITEEELITIVEEAEQEGGINAQEGELIRSAIEFNDLDVLDVLTPRTDIAAISDDDDKEKIAELFLNTGYSRIPVYHDRIDNIIGIINQKDFHNYVYHSNQGIDTIIKPAVFSIPTMKISVLLRMLQKTKSHIAVITDEYGGTMGIVTLEDIIEELVGEIWDEHDEVVNDFEQISDNIYKVNCSANLDKMFKLFDINLELDISTVSGWVTEHFGRIPNEGDCFSFENLDITVTKTDPHRVLEITVVVHEKNDEDEKE